MQFPCEAAAAICEDLFKYQSFPGSVWWNIVYFYYALSLAALSSEDRWKNKYWKSLLKLQQRIEKWAQASPMNYQHQYLLLCAEIARLAKRESEALKLYEKAILVCKQNGYLAEEALANELAAKFYLSLGIKKTAFSYLQEAYQGYMKWGATAKLKLMQDSYGEMPFSPIILGMEGDRLHPAYAEQKVSHSQVLDTSWTTSITSNLTTLASSEEFDLATIVQASQTLSGEIVLNQLLSKLMHLLMATAGASKIVLMLNKHKQLFVQAEMEIGQANAKLYEGIRLEAKADQLCLSIVHYVERSFKEVLLSDATLEGDFCFDPYIQTNQVRSILCLPLVNHGALIGLLYLENRDSIGAFTHGRLQILKLLSSQIAISLENALFYADLETKVEARTAALEHMHERLIQQEKMAYLGLLTAGIAHEMRNPLNFVINFTELSADSLADLSKVLEKYQNLFDKSDKEVVCEVMHTLQSNQRAVIEQGQMATSIVNKMIEHTPAGTAAKNSTDLPSLIHQAVQHAYTQMRDKLPDFTSDIAIDFDPAIKKLTLSAEDIYRVLLYLLNNAFFSVWQKKQQGGPAFAPAVSIKMYALGNTLEIRIRDNGLGIAPESASKIFTPFFTTKPPGQGTGLSLSLSHSIVIQHGGTLCFNTVCGEYAEFIITLPA